MRLRLSPVFSALTFLCFFTLFGQPAARAQQPVSVDPYEVLYGKRLTLPRREPPPDALRPPAQAVALVQARTDTLLARLSTLSATFGANSPKPSVQKFSNDLRKEHAEILALRDGGKPFAAWWKTTQFFLFSEFLFGFMEAILKEVVQNEAGGQGSLSRLPELRAKLDTFRARILLVRPNSPGVALAVLDAQADWVDMTTLLDLVQNQPALLYTLFDPMQLDIKPAQREQFIRWVVEPILSPVVQWWIDEAELRLQVSQADAVTQPLRIEERSLRELSRAYAEAAAVNLKLLDLRAQGRVLPKRDSDDEMMGRIVYFMLAQRISYAQSHRDEAGLDAALTLLGTSFSAYRDSLYLHTAFEVATAPVLWGDEVRDTPEKARAATRSTLLSEESLRARQAAALDRIAVRVIPSPVILATQIGTELSDGATDDQERALSKFIDAVAMGQLAVAITAPLPGSASGEAGEARTGVSADEQAAAITACIQQLEEDPENLRWAGGFAFSKNWPLVGEALREQVRAAIFDTCTRARFLSGDMKTYFKQVFRNAYVDWWREVKVRERAAPQLTQTCDSGTAEQEEALIGQEVCSLRRQAMGKLSADERQVILWHHQEGLSYQDIGARLGTSAEAARKRVERAQGRVRELYKELARERDPISVRLPRPELPVGPGPAWALPDVHGHTRLAVLRAGLRRESAPLSFF